MRLNELGFDFSNASSFIIKRKNKIVNLVALIIAPIFTTLFLVFMFIYIFQLPIENNGVMINYGTVEYQRAFIVLLSVFGGISLLFWIGAFLVVFIEPKTHIIKNINIEMEPYYYIYDRNKEIYLTKNKMIIYDKYYQKAYNETDQSAIDYAFIKYIFWDKFNDIKDYKIKQSDKKTVLKFKMRIDRTVYRNTYKFIGHGNVLPEKIVEMVNVMKSGNNRTEKYYVYFIESINRVPDMQLPKPIYDLLNNTI